MDERLIQMHLAKKYFFKRFSGTKNSSEEIYISSLWIRGVLSSHPMCDVFAPEGCRPVYRKEIFPAAGWKDNMHTKLFRLSFS